MSTDTNASKRTPFNALSDMENPLGEIHGLIAATRMIFADDAHGPDLGQVMHAITQAMQRKMDDVQALHSEAYRPLCREAKQADGEI